MTPLIILSSVTLINSLVLFVIFQRLKKVETSLAKAKRIMRIK